MRSLTGVLFALALLGTACAGGSTNPDSVSEAVVSAEPRGVDNAASDPNIADEPDTDAANQSDSANDAESVNTPQSRSPIAHFLGVDYSESGDFEAQAIAQAEAKELVIATCMIDKGFQYLPRDVGRLLGFTDARVTAYRPNEPGWVDTYGFGVSTMWFAQSAVGNLAGYDNAGANDAGEQPIDPNQDYLADLSDGEFDAYYEALYGPPQDFDGEDPAGQLDYANLGCNGEASADELNNAAKTQQFYDFYSDDLRAIRERVQADDRIVDFNARLTSCVAQSGLVWVSFEETYQEFERRASDLEPAFVDDPFGAAGLDPEEMSDRELDEFYANLNRLPAESLERLAELQAEEIRLAQAVLLCDEGPLAYEELRDEVRVDYEQRFLAENADALAGFAPD